MNKKNNIPVLCTNCTGCGACVAVCTKEAISLATDHIGFWYAEVNNEKCVGCGLCTKMCKISESSNTPKRIYAIRHKNIDEVKTSRSGAFFIALAEYVLSKGGAVYGAAMDEKFVVNHTRIYDKSDLSFLKKSKYTQSYISNTIFKHLIEDVSKGMFVLFTGTGCQVAKAKHLLMMKKLDISRCFFMDIICHGVPTPKLWNDYINFIQTHNSYKLVSAEFRDKSIGWSKPFESLTFKRFRLNVKTFSNLYTKLFYSNCFLRESCFVCQYANLERHSDFTIGDYWGWEKACPGFNNDNKGVSLVLVNTEKANHIFSELEKSLNVIDCTHKPYLQHNLQRPTPKPKNYKESQLDYAKYGFETFTLKYGYDSKLKRFKRKLYSLYLNIKSIL